MKISNSKKQLARIISENGGWRDGAEWATQDHMVAFFSGGKPNYASGDKIWCANGDDGVLIVARSVGDKIKGFHNTILSRTEYLHLYPAPDADGWIEFATGVSPVKGDQFVFVKYRDGETNYCHANGFNWSINGLDSDIVAYRLHKPEAAPVAQEPKPVPAPETNPTIEQLAADYRNAKDYADRKQQEADDARADADVKLKALELAGEALGLLVSPISAKQEPELVITDWRDLRPGDVITCIGEGWMESFEGRDAVVMEIETKYYEGHHCIMASMNGIMDWGGDFKFIRRP